ALCLMAIFRIGATSRARRRFTVEATTAGDLDRFMEAQGRLWGARRDAVLRGKRTLWEAFVLGSTGGQTTASPPRLYVSTRFADFALRVRFVYEGVPLPAAGDAPPSPEAMLEDPEAAARLSGYLLSRLARRVHSSVRDGRCQLDLYFDA